MLAAVGGLVFFLASGDDDDDETSTDDTAQDGGGLGGGTTPGGGETITIPSLPDPDGGDGGGGGGGGSGGSGGDPIDQTVAWVLETSPEGVDEEEAQCLAELVASVAGEELLTEAGGDLMDVYSTDDGSATTGAQDDEIRASIGDCIDSEALEQWRDEGSIPW